MTHTFAKGTQTRITAVVFAVLSLALAGASCGKKSAANPKDYKGIGKALDRADQKDTAHGKASQPAKAPVKNKAEVEKEIKKLPGIDLSKLDSDEKSRFEALVQSLQSPCGKAQSLLTSALKDQSCVRASFAVRYVVALLSDGATDDDVHQLYGDHYPDKVKTYKIDTAGAPRVGPTDAQVKLVEFYDYGCPHCLAFKPVIDAILKAYPSDVVLYYKQFPLSFHTQSKGAAQAALAAAKQGKFEQMHDLLFKDQEKHDKATLFAYAKQLGLNMSKFASDYAAAKPQVAKDKAEGESYGVTGTPTLFINGRQYNGPDSVKYLKMWIDEELAVNR